MVMQFTRRGLAGLAGAALIPAAGRAQAAWPDRPIRMLVGFPAGGPTDFAARLLQEPLQQLWGQPIVIENRAGASQMIASEALARSAPDGYTLMLTASTHTTNPAVYARLPYDTLRDFSPIVLIYNSPTVLFVGKDSRFRSVRQLVDAAKREPGMASSTSGAGTSGHFALEMFAKKAGIELTAVAYRGAPPALADVVSGRVPMTFSTLSGALALAQGGQLRALAIAGPRRVPVLPNVPTLEEEGFGIADTSPWYGFMGPAGLPAALVNRIATDTQNLLKRPDVVQRVTDQGGLVEGEGPEQFAARIVREIEENRVAAREANIRAE